MRVLVLKVTLLCSLLVWIGCGSSNDAQPNSKNSSTITKMDDADKDPDSISDDDWSDEDSEDESNSDSVSDDTFDTDDSSSDDN